MKIGALKERATNEQRAAITPDVVKLFIKKGYDVYVEKDIGAAANFPDEEYKNAGAHVSSVPLEILSDADVILKVQATPLVDHINEIDMAKNKAVIIGLLAPYSNQQYIDKSLTKNLSTIAMELVPRITKAQNMDVLSSQSNLAGYRAVIEAAYYFDRAFPMMMTAAGTVHPAKILILGVGVAGLCAIATAKRLGGVVSAYDVRAATKEQVESLGAKFVYPDIAVADAEDNRGYAKEATKDFATIQERFLSGIISNFDIVIATAQINGKKAPILVTKEMINSMKQGSVLVDLAVTTGGNIEGSISDKIVSQQGVKIISWDNISSRIASDSSRLFAKNLYNFLDYAIKDGKINFDDELVQAMLVGHAGNILNKKN